ncbi:MAG: hypothetical protein USCGTAYLOR_02485 [Chromatiales bacterium USCg_Taylor]|nr:MAG: hypothetical protein USCGTAYLOR_02485 [Chromatiales bacterium USCg_Taylor]
MTPLERALIALARRLSEIKVSYMLVGGMANAVWGEPRATLDIDVTVWVADEDIDRLVPALAREFTPRIDHPRRFIEETRVLPLRTTEGVNIDMIFGMLPFEQEAIERAVPVRIRGTEVRCCTPEDLILLKIISDRPQDRSDARGILLRRLADLDLNYLEPRIRELAEALGRPDITDLWEGWKREA